MKKTLFSFVLILCLFVTSFGDVKVWDIYSPHGSPLSVIIVISGDVAVLAPAPDRNRYLLITDDSISQDVFDELSKVKIKVDDVSSLGTVVLDLSELTTTEEKLKLSRQAASMLHERLLRFVQKR